MGAAGLASVRERFSVERMVLDTLRVYQRVAMHASSSGEAADERMSATAAPRRIPRGSPSGRAGTRRT